MLRNRMPRVTDADRSMRSAGPDGQEVDVPDDVLLALTSRVNLLLMGTDRHIARTLDAMRWFLPLPVSSVRGAAPLELPTREAEGTLIVCEVGALNRHDQRLLDDWLREGRGPGVQVVSTTTRPLMPLMREGILSEQLYYQLNTVCVDLSAL